MLFSKTDFTKHDGTQRPVFKDLPPGLYTVRINGEETKPTKAGTGEYLQLTFEVCDGPHTGSKIFAQATLQAICEAAGLPELNESSDLLGKTLRVATLNESYQDKIYPRIRSYSAIPVGEKGSAGDEFIDDLPF
jgi:Protein of unknown function (DUF669)